MLRRSKSRRGQGLTEYGLLIALVLGILVLVVPTIGLGYGYINSSVSSAINSAIGGGNGGGGGPPTPTPAPPVTYRAAVLATNPLAYWRLGEASGTVAVDELGLNNGTYSAGLTLGVVGLLTDDGNTAIGFPGGYHYMQPANPADAVANAYTVAVWAKSNNVVAVEDLLSWRLAGSIEVFDLINVNGTMWGLNNGELITTPLDGNPHFWTLTYDGTTVTLYKDGASIGSVPSLPANPAGCTLYIGMDVWDRGWTGTIDEPAIWNRALTADEIASLYAAGTGL